jgi:predicted DNA-binding transcriptional regulator AlpA
MLFDTIELARRTGLATSTLTKMRLRGDGPPFVKLGSRVLYDDAAVDAWLASQPQFRSTAEYTAARRRAGGGVR